MFIGTKNIPITGLTQYGPKTVMIQCVYLKGTVEEGFQSPEVWDVWINPQVKSQLDAVDVASFTAIALIELDKAIQRTSIDCHNWSEVSYG